MQINIEYVQGEMRDGYYVQPMMKRRWMVELDMLKEIDHICRSHGIKYFGWYGTLLGAVRHRGFIPWDDDMDLAMLREDYERFQYVCREELPEGWTVSKVQACMICVKNTDVIRLDQKFLDRYHGYPLMVGVDIFCLDHLPLEKREEDAWLELYYAASVLYVHWGNFKGDVQWEEEKWVQLKVLEDLTGYRIDRQRPVKEQLYTFREMIAAMYRDTGADKVAYIPWMYEHRDERVPRSYFEESIEIPFEDMALPVLKERESVCRILYGKDYMTPVGEPGHDNVKDQVEILRAYFNEQGLVLPDHYEMRFEKPGVHGKWERR